MGVALRSSQRVLAGCLSLQVETFPLSSCSPADLPLPFDADKSGRRGESQASTLQRHPTARSILAAALSELKRREESLQEHQEVWRVRAELLRFDEEETLLAMHNTARELCLVGDVMQARWLTDC
eukprot:2756947-Rhodomonas_salina.1